MCAQNQANLEGSFQDSQKITDAAVIVVYPSWTMKNALVALVNLATLLVGITIGIMLAPHLEKSVQAVGAVQQSVPTASPNGLEQITPTMTAGSVGAYLLLAHHIQSDELVVGGLDMVKLQQGELNLLARTLGINPQDVQNIVNDAKDTHLYQVTPPKQPQPATVPHR